jgi:Condensation domain
VGTNRGITARRYRPRVGERGSEEVVEGVSTLIGRLAGMSDEERARFLARLRGTTPGAHPDAREDASRDARRDARRDALVPRGRSGGPAPASFVQEQLWFLHQLAGGRPAYNVPFSFRLRGPLAAEAMLAAIADVVGRHDVLRARLVLDGGRLVQVPLRQSPVPVPVTDAPGRTAGDREAAAHRRADALARTRFDLAAGPLVRLELVRLGPEDHLLVWVAHHVVADGWSVGLLLDELRTAYRARLAGNACGAPPPRLQFADFAEWQRGRLAGERLDALLGQWRDRLAGTSFAGVPTDFPRPPQQGFRGESVAFELPAGVAGGVDSLSRQGRTTAFVVLLAAFQVLLARHAGTRDVVVGVPLAGRSRPELESMIGPLSNTLPVRVDLGHDPAFSDVLARAAEAMLDTVAQQEVPFGRLTEAQLSQVGSAGRDPSRNPLFQVVFNMGTLPRGAEPVELAPGLTAEPGGHPNGTARMDLELTMERTGGRVHGRLDYDVDLFAAGTARRLVEQLRQLLSAIVAGPRRRLSEIPLLAAVDRQRLAPGGDASVAAGRPAGDWARQVSDWLCE